MRPGLLLSAVTFAALLAPGCRHLPEPASAGATPAPRPSVEGNLIVPESSARMNLQDNQLVIPGRLSNPEVTPAYPPALLALGLPEQTVCIGFVVGVDGSVSGVRPLYATADCPPTADDTRPEFLAATVAAVSQWDYFSYIRCTFPPGTPDAQKCNGEGTTAEQVAVSLAYRFSFSVRDGVGMVRQAQ